jgi:hypothetical protein
MHKYISPGNPLDFFEQFTARETLLDFMPISFAYTLCVHYELLYVHSF